MKEQRMKILEMLKDGIISVEAAERLLNAVDGSETSALATKRQFKTLVIDVKTDDGDDVKINLPIEFVKLLKGGKFNVDLDDYDVDVDALIDLVTSGAVGELVNINSDGDHVVIRVE